MRKLYPHGFRLLGCLILLAFAAAGCFQQAGDGSSPSVPISQALPSETPVPPTDTPTPPEPTSTPEPTLEPTVDPATLGQGGAELEGTPDDAGIFPTFTPQPLSVAQAQDPGAEQTATTQYLLDTQPLYVTATAFILQATQTVEAQLTGTVSIPPTFTPPPPTIDQGAGTVGTQPVVVQPGVDCVHEVRAEDRNLYRISLNYGVPVRDIAAASGITNINLITIGQKLVIPGCGTTGAVPPPTSIPSGTDGTTSPGTGSTGGGRIHIVEQGQTLFEISLMYNVPVANIAAANGISNINLIYLGQELVIP